ncbi:MAG TPA: DNA-3-methyladenine glycosylase I [Phycisphaerales bacterium]|nr:DNA-3-methyladenine glycosylase I [Phycisphaerales bacterium]HMP38734.1 DNA-3-methyladenine glycosylase I [Phycisphaerales bacterium]
MTSPDLSPAGPGRFRCRWCGDDPLYVRYHDEEWGRPSHDDRHLFEKIVLEGFQSGLSWLTILRKRDAFRRAFAGFDLERMASFGAGDVLRLLEDASIVRHRGKIESAINNARRCIELVEREGTLDAFLWGFAPSPPPPPRTPGRGKVSRPSAPRPGPTAMSQVPASTAESVALSKELRRRGWTYVGPTTLYAMMQATGMVNDHLEGCWWRSAAHGADC